jgi:hypothetical protein
MASSQVFVVQMGTPSGILCSITEHWFVMQCNIPDEQSSQIKKCSQHIEICTQGNISHIPRSREDRMFVHTVV